jgi:hypothetical protein
MSESRRNAPFHWTAKAAALLFSVFCLELGAFLMVFPWLDLYPSNWFIQARPEFTPLLTSNSFRGAMTGLGCLNVLVGVAEALRLRRFAERSGVEESSGGQGPPAA